ELQELRSKHSNVELIQLDVLDLASIEAAVNSVGTSLNLLINNAAILHFESLENVTMETMTKVCQTNVIGPLMISKMFLSHLKEAAQQSHLEGMNCNKAAIINISSIVGSIEKCPESFIQQPFYSYYISKAGLNMASRCLSEDLRQHQILCAAIHPGWVRTDMGGLNAPLTVTDSVSSMMKVLANLSQNDTGKYLDWEGKVITW
uniref:C-signal-like n=1 Tax=Pristiophorus japonicus TaxID=55135 RepID=UPI00398F0C53